MVRASHPAAVIDVSVAGEALKAEAALACVTANAVDTPACELVLAAINVFAIVNVYFAILSFVTILAKARVVVVAIGAIAAARTICALVRVCCARGALPAGVAIAREHTNAIGARALAVAGLAGAIVDVVGTRRAVPPSIAIALPIRARPMVRTTDAIARVCCRCLGRCRLGRCFRGRGFGRGGAISGAASGLWRSNADIVIFFARLWNTVVLVEVAIFNRRIALSAWVGHSRRPKRRAPTPRTAWIWHKGGGSGGGELAGWIKTTVAVRACVGWGG